MSAAASGVLAYPVAAPPPPGEVHEIAAGVLWLRMPLPFALDHINLWLLPERDGGCTLVDCGYGDVPTRALWERHAGATLRTMPIRRIVATHYHPDHVGNAAWLSRRFDAPVAMTNAEYLTAHAMAEGFAGHTPEATIDLFRRHGMAEAERTALAQRGNGYRRGVPELPQVIHAMQAGDAWPAGDTTWRIIGGHGHSPDHASLFCAERGVLISGDMLLPKISTNVSVHSFDPDGNPLRRFLDSISAFLDLPADTLVLPSHGLPFRGIPLRVGQLRAHHDARLGELEDTVRAAEAPLCAADLVPVLFRRVLDLQQRYFAMGEAIAHLNYLWRAARLQRLVDATGTIRFAPPVG